MEAVSNCPQIIAVGVNCTAPQHVEKLLKTARSLSSKYLVAYPNSGEIFDPGTKSWKADPLCLDFVTAARSWRDAAGQSRVFIGGCCRTTPHDIARLSEDAKQWMQR
eukprot:scaffold411062_cov47-Prasinocladus_malaysianus.AAC.1